MAILEVQQYGSKMTLIVLVFSMMLVKNFEIQRIGTFNSSIIRFLILKLYWLLCRYGVKNMNESARKIYESSLRAPYGNSIILLAHNGPTGDVWRIIVVS